MTNHFYPDLFLIGTIIAIISFLAIAICAFIVGPGISNHMGTHTSTHTHIGEAVRDGSYA